MTSNSTRVQARRGFTLVELLVVIGIIAVLISMLLPSLQRARASARTLQCAAGFKDLGSAFRIYAQNNGGRYPGSASEKRFTSSGGVAGGSVAWLAIMDREYFKVERYDTKKKGMNQYGCPEYVAHVSSARSFLMNGWANGGAMTAAYPAGEYGVFINPPPEAWYSTSAHPDNYYRRGTRTEKFRSPSQKFLIIETERANDTMGEYVNNAAPGAAVVLGGGVSGSTTYPIWSTKNSGQLSFRHNNYTRANFLFVDGHVEGLTPKDEILSKRRFHPAERW